MKASPYMVHTLQYMKALADETRLRLLHVLCKYELNVNELVRILEMGQSRISRHLKILTAAELLVWRREGLWIFYSAAKEGPSRDFIDAMLPFLETGAIIRADMVMAASLIEDRARTTRQFFNAIAEDWDGLSHAVLGNFDLPGAVLDRMPACSVAVDLGCGTGNVLGAMLGRASKVIGVDGSPRMLELARRRFAADSARVSLRIGDLEHLPLADAEADFVSLNMVLHHLSAPKEALREVRRVLSPEGTLLLTDFDRHEDERMRSDYGDRWLGFDSGNLRSYLEEAGFTVARYDLAPVERALSLHIIVARARA